MAAWMETFRGVVFPWHCDQFGHMNVRWYAHFFDDAAFHIWPMLGFSLQEIEDTHGVHTVVARTTTDFVRELKAGDLFRVESGVGRIGTKSLTYRQRMVHVDTGETHAMQDAVEVFFDPKTRQSAPLPDAIRPALARISHQRFAGGICGDWFIRLLKNSQFVGFEVRVVSAMNEQVA